MRRELIKTAKTVEEAINCRSDRAEADNSFAKCYQSGVYVRPDKHQYKSYDDTDAAGDNRDAALSAEKRERVG